MNDLKFHNASQYFVCEPNLEFKLALTSLIYMILILKMFVRIHVLSERPLKLYEVNNCSCAGNYFVVVVNTILAAPSRTLVTLDLCSHIFSSHFSLFTLLSDIFFLHRTYRSANIGTDVETTLLSAKKRELKKLLCKKCNGENPKRTSTIAMRRTNGNITE